MPPGRGEPKPSEIVGLRLCQVGTGHTHRPANVAGGGVIGARTGAGPPVPVDGAIAGFPCRPRVSAYAATPPPTSQGSTRTHQTLLVISLAATAAAQDPERQPDQPGADQDRSTEAVEQSLDGLVHHLADRVRGIGHEVGAIARGCAEVLRQVRDARLDGVDDHVPLARRLVGDRDLDRDLLQGSRQNSLFFV